MVSTGQKEFRTPCSRQIPQSLVLHMVVAKHRLIAEKPPYLMNIEAILATEIHINFQFLANERRAWVERKKIRGYCGKQ